MKKKIIGFLTAFGIACFCLAGYSIIAQATSNGTITVSSDLTIKVNGQKVNFTDAQPFIDDAGRTQIPIRFISEELGFTVDWRGSGVVSINNGEDNMNLRAGSPQMYCAIGGVRRTIFMDTSAKIINDRTYIPLRYIAEAFGYTVEWNNSTGSGNSGLTGEEAIELVRQEIENKGTGFATIIPYAERFKLKYSISTEYHFDDRYIVHASTTTNIPGATGSYFVYKNTGYVEYLGVYMAEVKY